MTGTVWTAVVVLGIANLASSAVVFWYTASVCKFRTSALTTSLFLFSLTLFLSSAAQSVVFVQMALSQPKSLALLVSLPTSIELVALLLLVRIVRT
jgi:hypothetical protein